MYVNGKLRKRTPVLFCFLLFPVSDFGFLNLDDSVEALAIQTSHIEHLLYTIRPINFQCFDRTCRAKTKMSTDIGARSITGAAKEIHSLSVAA